MDEGQGTATPQATAGDGGNTNEQGGQGMGMGHNDGMLARHMAQLPEAYAGMINPIPTDDESLARGEELYAKNYASCYGDGGMGDGPAGAALDPTPSPIAWTSQMIGDDTLFWRLSEGGLKAPFSSAMPAWKEILSEDETWDVINYVRALGSGAVQPRESIGGDRFDPQAESKQRAEMLENSLVQGVITQSEASTFETVHAALDAYVVQNPGGFTGRMEDVQAEILELLVAEGVLTQEQVDTFNEVHDRLLDSGLMH